MAFEVVERGEDEKYQLPFMRQTSRKRKYRFPNYDRYDRMKALKMFLDPSLLISETGEQEYPQNLQDNPRTTKFVIANHSAYRKVMDHALLII